MPTPTQPTPKQAAIAAQLAAETVAKDTWSMWAQAGIPEGIVGLIIIRLASQYMATAPAPSRVMLKALMPKALEQQPAKGSPASPIVVPG